MGGLTVHLPLQFMENSVAKSFGFHLKPSLLNNDFHIVILVCSFMLCKESNPKKLQRCFSITGFRHQEKCLEFIFLKI